MSLVWRVNSKLRWKGFHPAIVISSYGSYLVHKLVLWDVFKLSPEYCVFPSPDLLWYRCSAIVNRPELKTFDPFLLLDYFQGKIRALGNRNSSLLICLWAAMRASLLHGYLHFWRVKNTIFCCGWSSSNVGTLDFQKQFSQFMLGSSV
jgi:hypothetical protein